MTAWIDHFPIDFGGPTIRVHDVIEIETTEKDGEGDFIPFCDSGDSGALVFEPMAQGRNRPVGLLFGKSSIGGPGNTGLAYANPIDRVLRVLGVKIVV